MKEHPILFSGPMVRAILADQKTQTRRLLTSATGEFGSAPPLFWKHANFEHAYTDGDPSQGGQYLHVHCHRGDAEELVRLDEHWRRKGQPDHGYRNTFPDCGPCEVCDHWGWRMTAHRLWPRVKPGSRLWVREGWRLEFSHRQEEYSVRYAADRDRRSLSALRGDDADQLCGLCERAIWKDRASSGCSVDRWRPSIHMPRWASRITLEVTEVRIQRLQEISEEDAKAEGIQREDLPKDPDNFHPPGSYGFVSGLHRFPQGRIYVTPQEAFAELWDSINGKRAPWESNPWVWAISFRRLGAEAQS